MTTRKMETTRTDPTLGQDGLAAAAALVAFLLLVPLAVFAPWLVVLSAAALMLGRALAGRHSRR
jgi:hypothetical protein